MRILVADDNCALRSLVQELLGREFDIIGTVDNGKALVDAALRLNPEIVVTDISMPMLSGIEAAKQSMECGSKAKVIFLTVHSDPDFVDACRNAGGSGYVVKVRMDSDLLPAIREALAGRIFVSELGENQS